MDTNKAKSTKRTKVNQTSNPVVTLWRIRSSYNGNPLGCYNDVTTEQAALDKFHTEMAPIVLDVYAEPVQTTY